eukprot:GGOE01036616.1.p1 GENE.GGOE01036616.1~~GGOE01036616.1.p1  ORF type:complete len:443 (+),score=97.60 GGOE01036616.1:180-1331(+)
MTPGVILRSRPPPNTPVTVGNFDGVDVPVDCYGGSPAMPHVMAETLYFSIDPYLRCRFNAHPGVDYTTPYTIGQPLSSAGIGCVMESTVPGLAAGDLVLDLDGWPWQRVVRMGADRAASLRRIPPELALLCPLSFTLGCIGQTGVTAYFGMLHECPPQPGDCVVVSGAAGAVGSVAGQLAKLHGCRVVGIAGSTEKCRVLTSQLGFDAAVSYKSPTFHDDLAAGVGASGARIYFDNVGGAVSDAVIEQLRPGGHIVLCGQISMYNTDIPYPPPLPPSSQAIVEQRGITRRRYQVFNYPRERLLEGTAELLQLVAAGQLVGLEQFYRGVRQAPNAFLDLMEGRNLGKQLVQVSTPPFGRTSAYGMLRDWLPRSLRSWVARRVKW